MAGIIFVPAKKAQDVRWGEVGGVAVQCAPVLLSDTTANIAKKSDWGMFKPTLIENLCLRFRAT